MSLLTEISERAVKAAEKVLVPIIKKIPGATPPKPQPQPQQIQVKPGAPPAVATKTKEEIEDAKRVLTFADAMSCVSKVLQRGTGYADAVAEGPEGYAKWFREELPGAMSDLVLGPDADDQEKRIREAMEKKLLSQDKKRKRVTKTSNIRI